MEFKDMYITSDEYFDILRAAWYKSEYAKSDTTPWHPEDLHVNMQAVFNGVGEGLVEYVKILGERFHRERLAAKQELSNYVNPNMDRFDYYSASTVPVFGGNLPRGEWDNYNPSYASNTFGDNV